MLSTCLSQNSHPKLSWRPYYTLLTLRKIFIVLSIVFLLPFIGSSTPGKLKESPPNREKKVSILISAEENVDLLKVSRKITISRIPGARHLRSTKGLPSEKALQIKMLFLLQRVQNLLNMYPKVDLSINIHVFKDQKSLEPILKKYGKNIQVPAFFSKKKKTIYLSVKKIDEYILAHELAHAVMDSYFVIPPPERVEELLAIYCDSHLKDKNI